MVDSSGRLVGCARARLGRRPKKSDAASEALGRSRGGFSTKLHVICDALGNPLCWILTPGQAGDAPQAEPLLRHVITDPERTAELEAVLADKGYDSDAILSLIASWEAEAVMPSKKNRKEQREIDGELYKDRNKVECLIGRVKQYRRIATRYEKTARNYLAMLHLVSAMVWLL